MFSLSTTILLRFATAADQAGSCVGREKVEQAVAMAERTIRGLQRQLDRVEEERAAPETGRRPPAARPEMERERKEVDERIKTMQREARPLVELKARFDIAGQDAVRTEQTTERTSLQTAAAGNGGKRPGTGTGWLIRGSDRFQTGFRPVSHVGSCTVHVTVSPPPYTVHVTMLSRQMHSRMSDLRRSDSVISDAQS